MYIILTILNLYIYRHINKKKCFKLECIFFTLKSYKCINGFNWKCIIFVGKYVHFEYYETQIINIKII